MKRLARILVILILFPAALSVVGGWFAGPMFLHPIKRPLTPTLVREADESFKHTLGTREDFTVRAPDGALLRGWKVRAEKPNGSWVLLFHGVSDNRIGVVGQSEFLLQSGYCVVMMDSRSHGDSGGPIATYGWLERKDTTAVIDALELAEHPQHLFALGESMGAGIALQSAGADPRIEAVVAEASFANLRRQVDYR
jgi:alpha-beta hydrolase superfamily lysophospholipase